MLRIIVYSCLSKIPGAVRFSPVFLIVMMLSSGCQPEQVRSFYYWKSVFSLSDREKEYLADLNIRKLYVKFFDVDLDDSGNGAVPVARIRFAGAVPAGIDVVPVVYITNRTLINTPGEDIADLAGKIVRQVDIIARNNSLAYKELQIDCDWTDKTRERYFALLGLIRKQLREKDALLSVTIRLHQVKYKKMTGVPPADRGMLMYYNMGKITADDSPNSVFNSSDASKYIDYLPDYPLPLDVALPAFSWGIHVRDGKVTELLNNMTAADFGSSDLFARSGTSIYTARKAFFFRGWYFMKDDIVKIEEISPRQCLEAATQLKSKLQGNPESVVIYHLDSLIISHYEKSDFEKVFSAFR